MPTSTTRRRDASGSSGKTRLDRDSIIAAGLELAAASTTSLSVRELGAHLGADPTAIYRHFRNKDQLMQALLDELTRRSLLAVTADADDWRGRLRQLAASTLEQIAGHPPVGVEATVLTTHGTGELDAIEFMLDCFSRAGLTGDDLVRHYALLASHMLSSAAGIARARGEQREHGIADDAPSPWFEGPLLADPRRYPLITSINTRLLDLEDRELFMLGVEAVIQSAERTAADLA
ncbi:helix-turn-helix domain containing protein [Agromyces sp. H3Y2-19a]|uniref:TetR/AcrR family transcriptional regulator n=1 Tax=Agromyces TaxID=33877 RepID=UPI001E2EAFC3|nr:MULTISPECIES: helix-turn-helix domain-containing protein [Agromyces]MCD5345407.1 TetR/AcrR family transcriptional regulator [Agromyces sp. S2-1-8]MDF0515353.1 helix-turn-helix domain containing protein [Agromyces chromiiresistens]